MIHVKDKNQLTLVKTELWTRDGLVSVHEKVSLELIEKT